MNSITSFFNDAIKYITNLSIADIFDILIIACLIYILIGFIRRTNSSKVASGILILVIALWLSGVLRLSLTYYLLRSVFSIGIIAVFVLFQPEIRRTLEKMGSRGFFFLPQGVKNHTLESAIIQTVFACEAMSDTGTGALIVFERDNRLSDVISTGTSMDAQISAELMKNIFFDKAPLHDGAIVIRDGRIAAAGCMLPLSANASLTRDLGMRHRAGIGMSENSDALVVIVSEETGSISIAEDGMLKRHLSQDTFETLLRRGLMPEASADRPKGSIIKRIINELKRTLKVKKNASKQSDKTTK